MKKFLTLFVFLFLVIALFAQKNTDAKEIARKYLLQNAKAWQLSASDISDFDIQYSYTTTDNGLTHVYFIQQKNGIKVFNAIVNVNVTKEGEVIYAGNRFVSHLEVNASEPRLTAAQAIVAAATHFGIAIIPKLTPSVLPTESPKKGKYIFLPSGISKTDMHVQLRYQPLENSKIARLAYDLDIYPLDGDDHWSVRVDALTGEILDKNSWTVRCNFDHPHSEDCSNENAPIEKTMTAKNTVRSEGIPMERDSYGEGGVRVSNSKQIQNAKPEIPNFLPKTLNTTLNGGAYRVFKLPTESPLYGNQVVVTNPADPIASPFGWHDTDGASGAEFTYTRGNNVHAVVDSFNRRINVTNGVANTAIGGEANGGEALTFDFPYSPYDDPREMRNSAVTNLFYMNNMMHDMSFRYGMNEEAGAFQEKNYSELGEGKDFVLAQTQDGGYLPAPLLNNASFITPPDGRIGMMQMYLWSRGRTGIFSLIHRNTTHYASSYATFGPKLTTVPIVGKMAEASNCIATGAVRGKIALVLDTIFCSYAKRVIGLQDSGAIACIICGITSPINDTFPEDRNRVRIPVVTTSLANCTTLRNLMASDTAISLYRNPIDTIGTDLIDGDFDNGIIAHEYGHGISNRLTGGPQNVNCLSGGEQMGEGWSDFMALITTAKAGDNGVMKRSMGNFVLRLPTDGRGIRRYPYSTDMAINPHTYDNLFLPNGQVSPHPIGEIWATTLWDMYWRFTDKYGFDSNIMNTRSGNGKAIKLVFDGMKIQPCKPGMLDGRDAIIAADKVNNNGSNVCMIWETFARRGMGYSAFQGKGTSASDNVEAFDMPPPCIKTVKIVKTMTPSVFAGQQIEVRLKVYNHRDTVATFTLSDTLPLGCTYVANSSTRTATVINNTLSFSTIGLNTLDSTIIVYRLQTDPTKKSILQFYDNMENPNNTNWTASGGTVPWAVSNSYANTGSRSFFADGIQANTEKILRLNETQLVSGRQPVLRFYHNYDTEGGFDAGVVEVSRNAVTWENAAPNTFRNPALGRTYATFPFADKTYWGNSNGFVASYVDLSNFIGQNIRVRYRLRTDVATTSVGWAIDDVLLMDAINYNSGVRMIATSGFSYRDTVRTIALQRGTIVEPEINVSTKETTDLDVAIFPNPTQNVVNVVLKNPLIPLANAVRLTAKATLLSIDGKILLTQDLTSNAQINLSDFAAGLYFLRVETEKGVLQKKIVKQ